MPVKEGYYRFSETATTVYKCDGEHCRGALASWDNRRARATQKAPCAATATTPSVDSDGHCQSCTASSVVTTLVWVIVLAAVLLIMLAGARGGRAIDVIEVSWYLEQITAWTTKRWHRLKWAGNAVRILYLQAQVISKFTELQDVDWPALSRDYAHLLGGLNLDWNAAMPSLGCSRGWDSYTALLVWTLAPFALYTAALTFGVAVAAYQQQTRAFGKNLAYRGGDDDERSYLGRVPIRNESRAQFDFVGAHLDRCEDLSDVLLRTFRRGRREGRRHQRWTRRVSLATTSRSIATPQSTGASKPMPT